MMKRYDCTLDIERDYYVTDERTAIEMLQKQGVFVYLDEFGNVYNREKEYCLRIKEGKKESPLLRQNLQKRPLIAFGLGRKR